MQIGQSVYEGIPLFRLEGELDQAAALILREALVACLDSKQRALLLDVSGCSFVDSRGLSVLVLALHRQEASGGWLGVVGANPYILRLFDLIGLTDASAFKVFADLSEVSRVAAHSPGSVDRPGGSPTDLVPK